MESKTAIRIGIVVVFVIVVLYFISTSANPPAAAGTGTEAPKATTQDSVAQKQLEELQKQHAATLAALKAEKEAQAIREAQARVQQEKEAQAIREAQARVQQEKEAQAIREAQEQARVQQEKAARELDERSVKVYSDWDYQGASSSLPVGFYNTGEMGIGNESISSIKVPSGLAVTLYEHANGEGGSAKWSVDIPRLTDWGINDWTSSIRVEYI
jgi:Skp family chaperone for outer membrane proteins